MSGCPELVSDLIPAAQTIDENLEHLKQLISLAVSIGVNDKQKIDIVLTDAVQTCSRITAVTMAIRQINPNDNEARLPQIQDLDESYPRIVTMPAQSQADFLREQTRARTPQRTQNTRVMTPAMANPSPEEIERQRDFPGNHPLPEQGVASNTGGGQSGADTMQRLGERQTEVIQEASAMQQLGQEGRNQQRSAQFGDQPRQAEGNEGKNLGTMEGVSTGFTEEDQQQKQMQEAAADDGRRPGPTDGSTS